MFLFEIVDQIMLLVTLIVVFDCVVFGYESHVAFTLSLLILSASQSVKKIIEINPYMLGTMAGGAADCQFWYTNLGIKEMYFNILCFFSPNL